MYDSFLQNSLVVSFESGDIYKCNIEHQITETSESFENTENVMFPTVSMECSLVYDASISTIL